MPASDVRFALIDLEHMGRPESLAAYLIETGEGPVVVDPGPAVTLPRLHADLAQRGYRPGDLTALLLTHIHLDHAGASGTLARENPALRVHVHEKGAPHLVDPARLIGSATRLYGERMERLWGEIAAVPRHQVVSLAGGERLRLGGRKIEVAYTPGHAWHHVSYFDPETETAFVGDTGGVFGPPPRPPLPIVLPATPPPDFDLPAWLDSIERILRWTPVRLALTHFGIASDPTRHFEELSQGLVEWTGYAREALELPGPDESRQAAFVEKVRGWISMRMAPGEVEGFLSGIAIGADWQGLSRYLKRPD